MQSFTDERRETVRQPLEIELGIPADKRRVSVSDPELEAFLEELRAQNFELEGARP